MKVQIFKTIFLAIPASLLMTTSCAINNQDDSQAKNYYQTIYQQIVEFQGQFRLAIGASNQQDEFLIIPERSDLKYVDLYNGAIKIEPLLWNFNPTSDQLLSHLKNYVKTETRFNQIFDNTLAILQDLKVSYELLSIENEEVKKVIFLLNQIENDLKKEIVSFEVINHINDHVNNNDYLTSVLTLNGKPYIDFEFEASWSSKLYEVKNKGENDYFNQSSDIFFNMHLPFLIRLIKINDLIDWSNIVLKNI